MKTMGQKIKERRSALGMTQAQLADLLGVTPRNISRYETDMTVPPRKGLQTVAKVLGVSTEYLSREICRPYSGTMLRCLLAGIFLRRTRISSSRRSEQPTWQPSGMPASGSIPISWSPDFLWYCLLDCKCGKLMARFEEHSILRTVTLFLSRGFPVQMWGDVNECADN